MKIILGLLALLLTACALPLKQTLWYSGDERCPPPKDDASYSAPYNPLDHPGDYPVFAGADKPGWSCSYQQPDGTIVQFGDSRTPQQQWLGVWGNIHSND